MLLVVGPPFLWLLLFFALPFLIVLRISLSRPVVGQPPYSPLFAPGDGPLPTLDADLDNYALLFTDSLYWDAYLGSIGTAALATLLCLAIGYPMAYAIARSRPAWRIVLLMMVILPFWTSFLIRIYAWMGILNSNGHINTLLLWIGLIDEPLRLLHTPFAVQLGIVYAYLPFMVLPLYAVLERQEPALLEAAADLGCRPLRAFLTITLPLSMPGIVAGSLLVFVPAVGEFVIPELLGGSDSLMIGAILWTEFFANRDWPLASAITVAMLALVVWPLLLARGAADRLGARRAP